MFLQELRGKGNISLVALIFSTN